MPQLSRRTEALIEKGNQSALGNALFKTFASQYSEDNPTGVVNAGLAENALLQPWLKAFFERSVDLKTTDFTYGQSLVGSHRLFAALASFYSSHIHPIIPVEASHIACGNGLSGVLDHLASVLCDDGEAIILPTPFYNGFEEDMGDRSGVHLVDVEIQKGEHGELAEVERLEKEMERREEEGGPKVRAVLITNPHNPLGFCYKRETLLAYCRFAEKWDVWLLADEIYATSIYKSDAVNPQPFTSILSIDVQKEASCDPARVIQLYGASKDFGSNGLRIGVVVCQHNPSIHRGLSTTAWTMKISSAADAMWSSLLASPSLPDYIELNQAALAEAYRFTTSWLRARSLPYRPAYAGHFVLVDLRQYLGPLENDLKDQQLKKEVELLEELVEEGVFLGPGFSYFCAEAGFFRLTFSIRREDLEVGLGRLEAVLERRSKKVQKA
ncbi:pyridoxal phosphate-dependent transferase [Leucosporidium creatinivorum]|uniref:Pyridoxal phosphate-dependent transferase n=1 Tax=Leucosporidium creatinivorum TaxID=106004 RepID=A0A1Y2ETA7_9BASI|nr:pyridoxal phosphate-dependent transferase [Leucosporidium creatinivorum]